MRPLRDPSGYSDDLQPRYPSAQIPQSAVRRMPATHPDPVFFHFDFPRSLQMHRKLAVGIFITALLLSGAYLARRWNNYKAESLVYVQPAPPRLMDSAAGQHWPYDANTYESYIQQQIHNITRPDVLAAAVRKLPGWRGASESEQAAADRLGGAIEVLRVGSGYQLSISARATSAAEAAQMANAVAASYIDSATQELRAGDSQRIELLREERDRVTSELASDRTEQEALNKQLGVAAIGTTTADPFDEQISAIRAELVKARTDNDEAAARLTAMGNSGVASAALDAEADELVNTDSGMVSMKTALNTRRSQLISQMANLTPNHPQYKQDTDELAKINASIETMTKELRAKAAAHIQQRLKNDLERTSTVEAKLNSQLAQLTGAAGTATPRLQRSNDLAADIQRLQNRYAIVDEQFHNLTMDNNAPGAVYLSAAATPPLHAARGTVLRNGVVVIFAGFLLAIGAALLANNLDQRIYIASDVEHVLGFAPMALLPDLYEVGTGVAEEYMLRLAAAVEHAHQQGLLKSCIITGVAPGAGATTVSSRVSGMLEAMGRPTVRVDAVGVPQPAAPTAGSAELMTLPRGSRSSALLQRMSEESESDAIVVTDTAPLLISGETEYLARFVDSAIVVIESGRTTRAQLREVARTLHRLEVSAVGFVLNRVSLENANPGFRDSVHAIEKHLKAQTRAFNRANPLAQVPLETALPGHRSESNHELESSSPEEERPEENLSVAMRAQVARVGAALDAMAPHEIPAPQETTALPEILPSQEEIASKPIRQDAPAPQAVFVPPPAYPIAAPPSDPPAEMPQAALPEPPPIIAQAAPPVAPARPESHTVPFNVQVPDAPQSAAPDAPVAPQHVTETPVVAPQPVAQPITPTPADPAHISVRGVHSQVPGQSDLDERSRGFASSAKPTPFDRLWNLLQDTQTATPAPNTPDANVDSSVLRMPLEHYLSSVADRQASVAASSLAPAPETRQEPATELLAQTDSDPQPAAGFFLDRFRPGTAGVPAAELRSAAEDRQPAPLAGLWDVLNESPAPVASPAKAAIPEIATPDLFQTDVFKTAPQPAELNTLETSTPALPDKGWDLSAYDRKWSWAHSGSADSSTASSSALDSSPASPQSKPSNENLSAFAATSPASPAIPDSANPNSARPAPPTPDQPSPDPPMGWSDPSLWLIPNQDLQDQQAPPAAAADSAARRSPAGPSIPMRGRLPVRHVIPAAESRPSVPQSGGEATPQAAPQLRIASSSEPIPAFEPIADSVNASAVEQKSAPPHVSQEAEFRFAPPSLPGTVSQANELPYLFAAHSADRQGDYEDQPVKPANRSAAHSAPQPAARPAAQPVQPTFAAAQAPYISNPAYSNPASSNPALYSQAPYTPEPASSEPTADDLPYSAASRLGGLRNLLVSLGIRNLNKQTESVVPKSDDQPRPDRNPERPVYAQPFTSVAQEIAGNGNTPNVVTARPEIILPSAQASQAQSDQAEHAQAGHERPEHKSEQHKSEQPRTVPPPRAKRTEPPDDIQTLPSQRGQYRRRRG